MGTNHDQLKNGCTFLLHLLEKSYIQEIECRLINCIVYFFMIIIIIIYIRKNNGT